MPLHILRLFVLVSFQLVLKLILNAFTFIQNLQNNMHLDSIYTKYEKKSMKIEKEVNYTFTNTFCFWQRHTLMDFHHERNNTTGDMDNLG